jgi:Sec-independent protein translocase protein TatA
MSFFGLGGFEILVIGAIALFVLGPKRLIEGIRDGRKVYTDLKRQRDALQSLITEAIDLEDLKNQIDVEGVKESVKSLKEDLALDQVAEDVKAVKTLAEGSVPRDWKSSRPPVKVDSEIRNSIPDLDLGGDAAADDDEPSPKNSSESEMAADSDVSSDDDSGEVKS